MLRRDPWLTPCLAGAAPAYADSRVPEHPKYCRTFRFTCATSLSSSRGNPAGIIRIGLDKTSVHGKVIPAAITKKPRLGLPVVRGAGYYPEPHVVEFRAKFNPASLTAAITRNSVATGTGWNHGRPRLDAAFQAQLPSSGSVSKSSILAGEYGGGRVRIFWQSVTDTARVNFLKPLCHVRL